MLITVEQEVFYVYFRDGIAVLLVLWHMSK